jgi:hypothetical protein
LALGEAHGYRNAQVTVIAPTGTIGLLMDCDTTGIEPDFALVKFKKLAGGGYFKIINQSVPAALRRLGYREAQIDEIVAYCKGAGTLAAARGSPTTSCAPGLQRRPAQPDRVRAAHRLRDRLRLQPLRARRRLCRGGARPQRRAARRSHLQLLDRARLQRRGHPARQRLRLRHHDRRGRPAPAARAPRRSSTAPTSAAATASASSRRWPTSA